MKFKLRTAGYYYKKKEIKKLKKLGFTFEKTDFNGYDYSLNKDETEITILTLGELLDFIKEYGKVVISEDSITIYNDYLE